MKIAAVVPAYNEAKRISRVLDAIKDAKRIDEIVVVSDGSTDATYQVASEDPDVHAINLEINCGKGGAMRAGALATDADVVLFLDADLIGMDGEKIDALVGPVADDVADMAIGIFKGGRGMTDAAQLIAPYISGQRAMLRETFLTIPKLDEVRSGVETAITKYYRARKFRVARVPLEGCTHCMKEEKLGFLRGIYYRVKMYREVCRILLDGHEFKKT